MRIKKLFVFSLLLTCGAALSTSCGEVSGSSESKAANSNVPSISSSQVNSEDQGNNDMLLTSSSNPAIDAAREQAKECRKAARKDHRPQAKIVSECVKNDVTEAQFAELAAARSALKDARTSFLEFVAKNGTVGGGCKSIKEKSKKSECKALRTGKKEKGLAFKKLAEPIQDIRETCLAKPGVSEYAAAIAKCNETLAAALEKEKVKAD